MNRFKGTKGNWQLDDYGKELVISSKVDNQHILTMRVVNSHQEKKANAQLIAAAPELLEAIKGLLAVVDKSEGVHGYELNSHLSFWEEFEEVEFAEMVIKKALGNE